MTNLRIAGYDLVMTCGACPEQYDVFLDGLGVGYLRLRHGRFAACYPGVSGNEVYATSTYGDGIFEDRERLFHLTKAIQAIDKARIDAVYEGVDYESMTIVQLSQAVKEKKAQLLAVDAELAKIDKAIENYGL
jgi:hypothetical protein